MLMTVMTMMMAAVGRASFVCCDSCCSSADTTRRQCGAFLGIFFLRPCASVAAPWVCSTLAHCMPTAPSGCAITAAVAARSCSRLRASVLRLKAVSSVVRCQHQFVCTQVLCVWHAQAGHWQMLAWLVSGCSLVRAATRHPVACVAQCTLRSASGSIWQYL